MTKTKKLKTLQYIEEQGVGFWTRTKKEITIWIRASKVNDPNQWSNARIIEEFFRCDLIQPAQPDTLSGNLIIKIKGF